MQRLITYYLKKWKREANCKSFLLRGARQVGKTYAVRQLQALFAGDYVEIK